MAKLKKYDLQGKEVGEVDVAEALANFTASGQMIKDYIVALRANARQWSANTKGRSEINCSNKKPHRQKGTGSARQGSRRAPQYKGGGIVFGPKPKFDQNIRINRQERRQAMWHIVAEKVRNGQVSVLDSLALEAPKTKAVAGFCNNLGLQGRTLFLTEGTYETVGEGDDAQTVSVRSLEHDNLLKSVRNLQKTQCNLVRNTNGYELMLANNVVLTEEALKELIDWIGTEAKATEVA